MHPDAFFASQYADESSKNEFWYIAECKPGATLVYGLKGEISKEEFRQSIDQELQQQQTNLMAPIYQKANETVKSLAKAGGYIYVIDVNTALYIDPEQSVDLTPEARKVLGIAEGRTLESLSQEIQAKQAAAQAE